MCKAIKIVAFYLFAQSVAAFIKKIDYSQNGHCRSTINLCIQITLIEQVHLERKKAKAFRNCQDDLRTSKVTKKRNTSGHIKLTPPPMKRRGSLWPGRGREHLSSLSSALQNAPIRMVINWFMITDTGKARVWAMNFEQYSKTCLLLHSSDGSSRMASVLQKWLTDWPTRGLFRSEYNVLSWGKVKATGKLPTSCTLQFPAKLHVNNNNNNCYFL